MYFKDPACIFSGLMLWVDPNIPKSMMRRSMSNSLLFFDLLGESSDVAAKAGFGFRDNRMF